jgi:hypothetical protein
MYIYNYINMYILYIYIVPLPPVDSGAKHGNNGPAGAPGRCPGSPCAAVLAVFPSPIARSWTKGDPHHADCVRWRT